VYQVVAHGGDQVEQLLFTIDETAEVLCISRATVYRLLKSGELVGVRVGRLRRVTRQALDRYTSELERNARQELAEVF
jgi:excisionase family DNA binding protein